MRTIKEVIDQVKEAFKPLGKEGFVSEDEFNKYGLPVTLALVAMQSLPRLTRI